jgi:hypothetical protein
MKLTEHNRTWLRVQVSRHEAETAAWEWEADRATDPSVRSAYRYNAKIASGRLENARLCLEASLRWCVDCGVEYGDVLDDGGNAVCASCANRRICADCGCDEVIAVPNTEADYCARCGTIADQRTVDERRENGEQAS